MLETVLYHFPPHPCSVGCASQPCFKAALERQGKKWQVNVIVRKANRKPFHCLLYTLGQWNRKLEKDKGRLILLGSSVWPSVTPNTNCSLTRKHSCLHSLSSVLTPVNPHHNPSVLLYCYTVLFGIDNKCLAWPVEYLGGIFIFVGTVALTLVQAATGPAQTDWHLCKSRKHHLCLCCLPQSSDLPHGPGMCLLSATRLAGDVLKRFNLALI